MPQLGTVQLEAFMGNVATVANTAAVALEDGKVSLTEALQIAVQSVPAITSVFGNIKTTFSELKDLRSNEVTRVSNAFATRFNLENEAAEAFIELVVNALLANTALVTEGVEILKKRPLSK